MACVCDSYRAATFGSMQKKSRPDLGRLALVGFLIRGQNGSRFRQLGPVAYYF